MRNGKAWSIDEDNLMMTLSNQGHRHVEIATKMTEQGFSRSRASVEKRWQRIHYQKVREQRPPPIAHQRGEKDICARDLLADQKVLLLLARFHPERMQRPSRRPGTDRPRRIAPEYVGYSRDGATLPPSPDIWWR